MNGATNSVSVDRAEIRRLSHEQEKYALDVANAKENMTELCEEYRVGREAVGHNIEAQKVNKSELKKAKSFVGHVKFYEPQVKSMGSTMQVYMTKQYLVSLK